MELLAVSHAMAGAHRQRGGAPCAGRKFSQHNPEGLSQADLTHLRA
jgi:hypothetical protein